MLDNLRDDAIPSFREEDTVPPDEFAKNSAPVSPRRKSNGKFLGLTSTQRFILAVMLLVAVCTLGLMCLLLTGRIGLF
jgi:hypothetical protein